MRACRHLQVRQLDDTKFPPEYLCEECGEIFSHDPNELDIDDYEEDAQWAD